MKKLILWSVALAAAAAVALLGTAYTLAGTYGLHALFRRGGSQWLTVAPDDPLLSPAIRAALAPMAPAVRPGPIEWRRIGDGFDVAELAALIDGAEIDRLLLARIDPAKFRFILHNEPAGKELGDWMGSLGAALVINGSYFSRRGTPDTPHVIDGTSVGPADYDARHGAFVVTDEGASIRDLRDGEWQEALRGSRHGMVSYPLLLASDGANRVDADRRWLANRSFVGQDRLGRIILGTTADAFFSLEALAQFLRAAPLDLTLALNLDGGPVACQAISLAGFRRDF
jgi:hypothetical protein